MHKWKIKFKSNRILKNILILILILSLSASYVFAGSGAEVVTSGDNMGHLLIDGKDYNSCDDGTFTFGSNMWHTRHFKLPVTLPFVKKWETELGAVPMGQPIITDKYIITTAGREIMLLNKDDGKIKVVDGVEQRVVIQNDVNKNPVYSSPFYLENESGWFKSDGFPRVFIGTRDGWMYCLKITDNGKLLLDSEWVATANSLNYTNPESSGGIYVDGQRNDNSFSGVIGSPIIVFDKDKDFTLEVNGVNREAIYLIVGTNTGELFALNAYTGLPNQNRYNSDIGEYNASSPIAYLDHETGQYSNFAFGVNNIGTGHLHGGYVETGILYNDQYINEAEIREQTIGEKIQGIPTSIGVTEVQAKDSTNNEFVFLFSDRNGNLFGYNEKTKKIVFHSDEYLGIKSYNTPTIVDNDFAIYSLTGNSTKNGKIVALKISDLMQAQYSAGVIPESAYLWETDGGDIKSEVLVGATAITISQLADSPEQVIVIVGDKETDTTLPNLKAFYVKASDGKDPIRVDNAFQSIDSEGNVVSKWGTHLVGGVTGEPSFVGSYDENGVLYGGTMIVGSGDGKLTAFTFNEQNNLAITMAQDPLSFEDGNSYTYDNYITNGFMKDQQANYDVDFPSGIGISEVRVFDSKNVLLETQSVNNSIINPVDRWGNVNSQSHSDTIYVMGIDPIEEYDDDLRKDIITGYERNKLHFKTMVPMNGCRIEVDYDVPNGYNRAEIDFNGSIYNQDSNVDEVTFDDNHASLTLSTNMQNFTVTSVKASSVRSGEDSSVTVKIKNTGESDFYGAGSEKLSIKCSIDGSSLSQVREIQRLDQNETIELYFDVETPADGKHSVKVVASPAGGLQETTLDDNTGRTTFTVSDDISVCQGSGNRSFSKKETTISPTSSYQSAKGSRRKTCSDCDEEGHTHSYVYDHSYSGSISTSVELGRSDWIKSGHGTTVKVTISVSTSIYASKISFPSNVELNTDSGEKLLFDGPVLSNSGKTATYELKQSDKNILGERKHFIPVDWADGSYNLQFCTGTVRIGPGSCSDEVNETIEIRGNMYQDDFVK